MSFKNTENLIFCQQCGFIHGIKSHEQMYTEKELKIAFLAKNFNLKLKDKEIASTNSENLINKMTCGIKLERINLEEYIPLSKLKKCQKWKKAFKMKKYTLKLDRIKLIWDGQHITIANCSIKI